MSRIALDDSRGSSLFVVHFWSLLPGCVMLVSLVIWCVFFFQAEDGIRDLVRSRGLGDVYKRQDEARYQGTDISPEVRYDLMAEAMGAHGAYVTAMDLSLIHI